MKITPQHALLLQIFSAASRGTNKHLGLSYLREGTKDIHMGWVGEQVDRKI